MANIQNEVFDRFGDGAQFTPIAAFPASDVRRETAMILRNYRLHRIPAIDVESLPRRSVV
jgi:hypothetical protein